MFESSPAKTDTGTSAVSHKFHVIRWLAVLPGSLVSALLVTFPVHFAVLIVQLLGRHNDDASITISGKTLLAALPPRVLEGFGNVFFAPLVAVLIGTWIAPKAKLKTAVILAVLCGVALGGTLTYLVLNGFYSGQGWVQFGVTCALCLAGISLGLFMVHRAQRAKRSTA